MKRIGFILMILILFKVCKSEILEERKTDSCLLESKIQMDSAKTYYIVLWGTGFLSVSKSTFENWQKAGEDHFAFVWEIKPYFKTNTPKFYQEQKIIFRYGMIKNNQMKSRKSEDELSFQSKIDRHLTPTFDLQFNFKLNTQINNTYMENIDDPSLPWVLNSGFLSPGYIFINLGIQKKLPNTSFSAGFSGFKISIVKNQDLYRIHQEEKLFNVREGKRKNIEYGFNLTSEFKKDIVKNIELEHQSTLFMNKDRYQQIDVESRTILSLKVNKHIKTMIIHQLIYDEDIIPKPQVQQQILVGYYF